ncbi:MAG: hypothetical protein Q4D38_10160 [Planctomycetia bacterium]|nr:hypothetical protein [Planctomycetia bacterium]
MKKASLKCWILNITIFFVLGCICGYGAATRDSSSVQKYNLLWFQWSCSFVEGIQLRESRTETGPIYDVYNFSAIWDKNIFQLMEAGKSSLNRETVRWK